MINIKPPSQARTPSSWWSNCLKKCFCYQFKWLGVCYKIIQGDFQQLNQIKWDLHTKKKIWGTGKKGKYLAVNNDLLQHLQLCELTTETTSNTCFWIGDFPLGAVIKTTAREGYVQTTLQRKKKKERNP